MREVYTLSHDAIDCFARLRDSKGMLINRKADKKTYICDCLDSNDCYGCAFYKKVKVEGDRDD